MGENLDLVCQAEIHFHQQEELSVFLESNCFGPHEKAAQIGLFSMFALRTMGNFGISQPGDHIGSFLANGGEIVPALAAGKATGGFRLVSYPGYVGRKQFVVNFRWRDQSSEDSINTKGFGWFATGMGYYGPIAVFGLLRYLAVKEREDECFIKNLAAAATACGNAQMRRKIELSSLGVLGRSIIRNSCADYLNAESKDSPGEGKEYRVGDQPRRVDLSTIETPEVRRAAEQLNRRLERDEIRLHRATEVFNEFFTLRHRQQLLIAESIIGWTWALLAEHPRRLECELFVDSIMDFFYAFTFDAERVLSEAEQRQLFVGANAIRNSLTDTFNVIVAESFPIAMGKTEGSVEKSCADELDLFRLYAHVARVDMLRDLACYCMILCPELEGRHLGVQGSEQRAKELVVNISRCAIVAHETIQELLKSGELIIEDGSIFDPSETDDD